MNTDSLLSILFIILFNLLIFLKIPSKYKINIFLTGLLAIFLFLIFKDFLLNFLYFISILFNLLSFYIGLVSPRKYIFFYSFMILCLTSFLIYFEMKSFYEFLISIFFILITVLFIRDFIYEKVLN